MSQAGIIDVEAANPQIPTSFLTDAGSAIPIANVLEILGTNGITTSGAGGTVTVTGVNATAGATVGASQIGVSAFDSAHFTVTAGFVQLSGGMGVETFLTDDGAPAVEPNGTGQVNILGGTGIDVTGQGPGNTVTVCACSAVSTTFDTDAGQAIPVANIINILGGNNISTVGVGNTVTANLTGTTDHTVQVGNASGSLTSIGAGLTGELLIGATGAAPAFGTVAYGDFSFSQLAVGVPRIFSVSNTDDNVASTANIMVSVPDGGADGYVSWEIMGTRFYAFGPDNSVANDPMVLSNSSDPSSGDALITVTNTGVITLFNDLDVTEGGTGVSTFTDGGVLIGNGGSDLQVTAGLANGQLLIGAGVGTDPAVASITSTDGSIAITAGAGTLDLSGGGGVDRDNMLYVGKHGSDANDGKSPAKAKLTIQAAVTAAVAGDTVLVYPGTYTETVTHAASNVTMLAEGKPTNVIITQADANVINFGAFTGIQYKYFGISCTAATSALCTVQGSTGGCTFKECQLTMTCAANIAAVTQPSVGCLTGAGALKVTVGKVFYYHTGNGGGTANKGAFKVADGGVITLQRINDLTVSCTGTALVTSVGVDASSTGIFEMNDNKITVTDPNATIVAGFVYLGGTGVTHEFFRNTLHVTATNNAGFGFWSADTASKSRFFYNHIHVEDTAGSSNSFLVGNTAIVISEFDDIVAVDGVSVTAGGTFTCTSSEADGDLTCRGREAGGMVQASVMNTDNTNASSHAVLDLVTGGANGGDPYIHWDTGVTEYSLGPDNTSTTDLLKLTTGATPSAGTELITVKTSGEVNITTELNVGADSASIVDTSAQLTNEFSVDGAQVAIANRNTSDTAGSDAIIATAVAGSSAGDPYYSLSVAGAINMSFGLKNSDADNFYLNTGVGLAGTNLLKITHAGAVTMPLQPSFYAYNANAILNQFGDGTTYQVVYDTETYDTNSDYDHTTGAFTAPVTGTYIFNAKLAITTLTTAWTTCQFQINTNAGASGMPLWYGNPGVVQQGGLLQISGVRHVKLTAADTAYVTIRIANSAKTLDISANSWFSGSLLN